MASELHEGRLCRSVPKWIEYVDTLNIRFGSELHCDPMVQLKNFRQTESVESYLDKFDALLSKAQLSAKDTVSFFPPMVDVNFFSFSLFIFC